MSAQPHVPTYPPSLRLAPTEVDPRLVAILLERHAERIADVHALRLEAMTALAEERYLDLGDIGRRLDAAREVRDRCAGTLRKHGIEITDSMEMSR